MSKEGCGLYKFFKPGLGLLYKLYYNPKVYGKENIPKEGSVVIACNHIHVLDQCNIIIKCRRVIHYMAKKEYFDSKFGWFFKSVGCIPVDRSIHDDSAKESALEVLNNGWCLGIFPEGTRNGFKEEKSKEIYDRYKNKLDISFEEFNKKLKPVRQSQVNYLEELYKTKKIKEKNFINHIYDVDRYLLELVKKNIITMDDYLEHSFLPFKFGTISMAAKTNSLIIPCVVTGEYKFRSKNLKCVIGKPIKVSKDLDKTFKELRSTMLDMYVESLQIEKK